MFYSAVRLGKQEVLRSFTLSRCRPRLILLEDHLHNFYRALRQRLRRSNR